MSDHAFSEDEMPAEAVLIMPFVTVISRGGPHDDESYTCGWEMGVLDALLSMTRPSSVAQAIHSSNLAQADLVAMRYGYALHHKEAMEDGWTDIVLERGTDDQ